MIAVLRNRWKDRRGVSVIEFALAFPVFLAILFAMLELGVLFLASSGIRHAVNESARYATVYPTPTDAQITAKFQQLLYGLDSAAVNVVIARGEDPARGKFVSISATYTAKSLTSAFPFAVNLGHQRQAWVVPNL